MAKNSLPTSEVARSRHVPDHLKKTVWAESKSMCSYQSPITGEICGSKRFLEIDHKVPFSRGGSTQIENLKLLCDQHNRRKSNNGAVDHTKSNAFASSFNGG